MSRRELSIKPIFINRLKITKVVIDSHYEEKHANHINDDIIVGLVKKLDGRIEVPEAKDEDGYSYFSTLLDLNNKQYRLVWLLEDRAIYIGVLNAYRDNRKG